MDSFEKSFYSELGKTVFTLRKSLNITQVELAKKIGIPQSSLAYYETGKRRIPVSLLYQIAEVLNTDIENFLPQLKKKKPGPVSRVDLELAKVKVLPMKQQEIILDMIDSVIRNTP